MRSLCTAAGLDYIHGLVHLKASPTTSTRPYNFDFELLAVITAQDSRSPVFF